MSNPAGVNAAIAAVAFMSTGLNQCTRCKVTGHPMTKCKCGSYLVDAPPVEAGERTITNEEAKIIANDVTETKPRSIEQKLDEADDLACALLEKNPGKPLSAADFAALLAHIPNTDEAVGAMAARVQKLKK